MKKLIALFLVVTTSWIIGSSVQAVELNIGDQISKIPNLKQGIAYSLLDNDISYLTTVEALNWKGIALELGYSSKDKAVAVISYELLKLRDLGVTVPILDLIETRIGIYGGYGRLEIDRDFGEFDYGLSATLISVRF